MILKEIEEVSLKLGEELWKICFYKDDLPLFLTDHKNVDEDLVDIISPFLKSPLQDFRKQVHIKSRPFLLGIFFKEKKVRIASPRLGRELFLITELEGFPWQEDEKKSFSSFKEHADKLASLAPREFPSEIELLTSKGDLPDLLNNKSYGSDIYGETDDLVKKLLVHLNSYSPSLFERVSDFGLSLTAEYALIRIHLLKFLAILPSLDHDIKGTEVKRILMESVRRLLDDSKESKIKQRKGQAKAVPLIMVAGLSVFYVFAYLTPSAWLAYFIRTSVRFLAKRFIAGESIELASESLKSLYDGRRNATLDQLGELVVSEKEADHYCDEVLKLIRGFSEHVPRGSKNRAGVNRAHVSIKVSALCSDFKPYAFDYTYKSVAPRLSKILIEAKREDVFINVDAEHYHYRDIVFQIYRKVLLETEDLQDFQGTGIVIQAYLKDAFSHLKEVLSLAKERELTMPIRLVKGAYWDAETFESDAHSVEAPQFLNKEETDLHFRQLIIKVFEFSPHLLLCLASHNFSDHCFAKVVQKKYFPETPEFEHQCLHMTYEALSTSMEKMGWEVRNYVPVGSLIVGMAYLVRRIMENSSQVGVLTIMRSHRAGKALSSPSEVHLEKKKSGTLVREMTSSHLSKDFFNSAPVRMYLENERKWVKEELDAFEKDELGKFYENNFPVTGDKVEVTSSSKTDLVVGSLIFGTKADADKAVEVSKAIYDLGSWAKSSWQKRSSLLLRVSSLMMARRNEFASLIMYEAGKSVIEALGDVDEALDFLDFYAREEGRLQNNEENLMNRGVVAVISPWNFPLAIPCGMVSAPLVAGNTVILKSAEQTPLVAQKMVDLFHEAGVPKDALIHLPGMGEVVGEALVTNPQTAGIVFTGSRAVGTRIYQNAGQRMVKNNLFNKTFPVKVITEMGGKNAIIVTANAELDETVSGILYSSFAHAGQKCSAASRILVDERVIGRLKERLGEACRDMEVGEAYNFSTTLNPVISLEDKERLRRQSKEISQEVEKVGGEIVIDRTHEELPGNSVGPMVVELPRKRALNPDSFAMRELFGPIIHLIPFTDLKEALKIFNGTEYALTGGVFSQSQDDIDVVVQKMKSGNVYVNRTITGARVAIEPFGGFKFSGTGPKAGGTSYLGSFHISNEELVEESHNLDKEEEGSSYKFDLSFSSKSSMIPYNRRKEIFINGLGDLEKGIETLFGGIFSKPREVLKGLAAWVKNDVENRTYQNRKIPGQLNYNDLSLKESSVVVLGLSERPAISTLVFTLMAIYKGIGVTVLTRGKKSFSFWEIVCSLFRQSGLPKDIFDVYLTTEDLMLESFQNKNCRSFFIDATLEKTGEILSYVHKEDSVSGKFMKNFFTPFDAPPADSFDRYFEQLSFVRAFAINIMRHGAPMEIEGENDI
ncbi:bifunctional proline dehydrogenase/L-glutamate gamma-semialdehyde dehydrogenase [Bacteriovoracales bacterium]|nr:bifunctional proline dehydrogenase/L-glutamate gamma-semialdehyde dehydrogenase [Bacteriovoracales bacterium]